MKRSAGFTLIELMVTVAIVGVIAAIALPSYQNHVRKARRSEAQQLMLGAANKEEQYILEMRSYTADFTAMNFAPGDSSWSCTAAGCSNNFYDITIAVTAGPPPGYTFTAVPKNDQASDGNLTLDNTGAKTGNW